VLSCAASHCKCKAGMGWRGRQGARTIMKVSEEPRNWMFTKGAIASSSPAPACTFTTHALCTTA
jgi:hypothetical protein